MIMAVSLTPTHGMTFQKHADAGLDEDDIIIGAFANVAYSRVPPR